MNAKQANDMVSFIIHRDERVISALLHRVRDLENELESLRTTRTTTVPVKVVHVTAQPASAMPPASPAGGWTNYGVWPRY